MLRSAGLSEYKKPLLAAGAAVGVGLIAYRIWSRHRPPCSGDKRRSDMLKTKVEIPTVQKVATDNSDVYTAATVKSVGVLEPTTVNIEAFVSTAAKENFSINPEVTGADILSVSGTFVKVSPSASPVSFEEIGSAFVEPMSMPSTPPLIIEPSSFKSSDSTTSAYDQLNSSSMSFVAFSSESSETQLPIGDASELPLDLETTLSQDQASLTEKNDIIVIDTSSEHSSKNSSQNGDEDAEVVATAVTEQPDQSTGDATDVVPTQDILEHGADSATVDQSNE